MTVVWTLFVKVVYSIIGYMYSYTAAQSDFGVPAPTWHNGGPFSACTEHVTTRTSKLRAERGEFKEPPTGTWRQQLREKELTTAAWTHWAHPASEPASVNRRKNVGEEFSSQRRGLDLSW